MRPKVTVYVTCHNYGRYLRQAADSVLNQILTDWEMILIDDGSTDDSGAIIAEYQARCPDQIRSIINESPRGLPYCANRALELARGEYLVRLDADDYFADSALLAMATYLDRNSDIALVYPNYIYIDEDGSYLGTENRKKIGSEAGLLDLPAHGACTMVRRRILKSVGGYSEDFNAQDGYELWLKVFNRYKVANIDSPVFYYRQHGRSLTRNQDRVLEARQKIKRAIAERLTGTIRPKVVGIVPAKNTNTEIRNIVLTPFAGKPLIDHTIKAAFDSGALDHILVTSDDPKVIEHCQGFPGLLTTLRDIDLSREQIKHWQVIADAITHLETDFDIFPDVVVMLNVHSPLRRPEEIRKAVDTLLIYDVDTVTSVYEDYELHFTHGDSGLQPLNPGMLNKLRLEREALYVDNGSIKVLWRDVISGGSLFGRSFGHIVMPFERSMVIDSSVRLWMMEQLALREQRAGAGTDDTAQSASTDKGH